MHVSVAFTYDKPWAEHLAEKWRHVAPVRIGGVAYGDRGEEFVPGRYIKPGVWSRNEVVRIDFEDCGSFRPRPRR